MKLLISGSTGLIGSALVALLQNQQHSVTRLVRSQPQAGSADIPWNPATGEVDESRLSGFDAVIHLAGENVAGRWTPAKKARIYESRAKSTRYLSEALARSSAPPQTLLCASAIGYYGHRSDELVNEDSTAGTGFLAEVCRDWEAAADPARAAGIRVVHLRFGVVLSPQGGALAQMLLPFRLGLGGKIGSGRQYISWATIDDAVGAIHHALITPSLSGPINVVTPNPVTNQQFVRTLGGVLHRPAFCTVPAFALRLILGEMADETLLSSTRAEPARLRATGYSFSHPTLEGALRHLLIA